MFHSSNISAMKRAVTASPVQEDYLEVILKLLAERGAARVRDISRRLHAHKSTVSSALRTLAAKNLVDYSPYEAVSLTPAGRRLAEKVVRKHNTLKLFLTQILEIPEDRAEQNACRLEHHLGPLVLRRMEKFLEFATRDPAGRDLNRAFAVFRRRQRRKR